MASQKCSANRAPMLIPVLWTQMHAVNTNALGFTSLDEVVQRCKVTTLLDGPLWAR